ncbi:Peptidyl-prolyl cis-trans isomerase fkbp62, partial [Sarracenia purpurea var. burkii]
GFGEKGKPTLGDKGAVPPNATLQITLELVSWKTVTEVTDDKKFIKKTLKKGEGYERPNEGALVKLKLIGKLQDGNIFLKKGHDNEEDLFEFKIDEDQVIEGLDRAVMKMKKGEVALLIISAEYAFGPYGSQQELDVVPPNSTVYFEVELVSFVKVSRLGLPLLCFHIPTINNFVLMCLSFFQICPEYQIFNCTTQEAALYIYRELHNNFLCYDA